MTQITAKVIADSKNKFGNRLTTMVVTFPRIILADNILKCGLIANLCRLHIGELLIKLVNDKLKEE